MRGKKIGLKHSYFKKIPELKCPVCEKAHCVIDELHGEKVCLNCGTILNIAYPYVGGFKINTYPHFERKRINIKKIEL